MLKITTILILSFVLRIFGISWDQGLHLHPDERMLIMVAERVHFFDKLNPEFFNYGSLPIYLLRGTAQFIDYVFHLQVANYDGMLYLGRGLSLFADLGTVYFIYLLARKLFKNEKIAFLSSFFYSISFFAIQNSHFFIVDTFLAFFITVLLYTMLLYFDKPTGEKLLLLSLVLAAAITTKITAVIFLPLVAAVIIYKNYRNFLQLAKTSLFFTLLFIVFTFVFMPYAFLDWQKFLTDVLLQIKLNSDPYIFPYTLQYVGTLPYFYYLKNIFLWGLGPVISIMSVIGIFFIIKSQSKNRNVIIFLVFYLFYFLLIGRSAVKFMRYMLPLYPFLTILAGYGLSKLSSNKIVRYSVILICFVWTALFLNIYSREHTRVSATKWIQQNVPAGSNLAVEHWDDSLPLYGGEKYNFVELTLYDQPDDELKWQILNDKLAQTDYLIISSNRLYTPLQKLSDCSKFKSCYPLTAEYYKKLFGGQLDFERIAEFTSYPGIKIGDLKFEIPDDSADESFTVYDHPKVLIFKRL